MLYNTIKLRVNNYEPLLLGEEGAEGAASFDVSLISNNIIGRVSGEVMVLEG